MNKDYEEWLEFFLILERKVPGYLGTITIMKTGTDSSARHVIHRFMDKASLEAWENSAAITAAKKGIISISLFQVESDRSTKDAMTSHQV